MRRRELISLLGGAVAISSPLAAPAAAGDARDRVPVEPE
jgi:hypothetical protein